ncbi:MAG: glycosyl transferase family 1 [Gammaproteobacteria bacterium RIFCSPHIGHO2_12_FULL_42_10]|nr:MAG: glycosyl transferase family 1 [Gammaproteobacteria bacterium RIFCSPHIGHO2_12_FULL_42_10]
MKIAIVCDWLVTIGGAEKVLSEILTCFPEADLFAVIDYLAPSERQIIHNKPVQTTFIQKLPFAKSHYRHYLPLMPLAIEQLNLSRYDLVLSCSHAVAKGVITGPDQIHISYIHSPMRYAWDMQHQYLHESGLDKKWRGYLARYFLHKLRFWDARSAQGVDHFIANSHYIARRIQKTYRRDAEVIYPPVNLKQFTPHHHKEDYYFTASRLVPYKRVDLIVESFQKMPDKHLIVIGDGPDFNKIKGKAGRNVTLLGYQNDEKLVFHLQRAKAFIFAAEEDFGILPLEAQATGTPVIALNKGGARETVRGIDQEKPTGLFFEEQTIESICNALTQFEVKQAHFTPEHCIENAAKFSPERFQTQLINFVTKIINTQSHYHASNSR